MILDIFIFSICDNTNFCKIELKNSTICESFSFNLDYFFNRVKDKDKNWFLKNVISTRLSISDDIDLLYNNSSNFDDIVNEFKRINLT